MKNDTYLTVKGNAEGLYKEKGSKFLSFTFPVEGEEKIKLLLEDIKKKYHDARHHCYAYRLGREGDIYRANDAGEPNHSAGNPILGQIRSNNLTNILVVVVRYFGGTKLGVGGLINAYKTAAAEAISNSTVITKTSNVRLQIKFDYLAMNDVMRLIKDYELTIKVQEFEEDCYMELEVRLSLVDEVVDKLNAVENITVSRMIEL